MPTSEAEITRVTRSKAAAQRSYDRLSSWYDGLAGSSEDRPRRMGLQQLAIKTGEKVLEIGFGTGRSLVTIAQVVGLSGKVYGIDLSAGMLQHAQARLKAAGLADRVDLQRGDAAALSYPADFFDAVFMSFTLELFDTPELPVVIQECHRVLRARGRIGVVALAKQAGTAVRLYEWAHAQLPTLVDCRPIFVPSILEENGFEIVNRHKMSMWGLPVEVIVAQKM
jgi:ubiquinone/menaquinone biosynthesis C-methylase UbiE